MRTNIVVDDDLMAEHANNFIGVRRHLISNTQIAQFRATQAHLVVAKNAEHVTISSEVAQALHVQTGDFVRILSS